MKSQSEHLPRTGRLASCVASLALVATGVMIAPVSAAAEPGNTTFRTSFEAADPVPVLQGTGAPNNTSGLGGRQGSVLGKVVGVTASAENLPNEGAIRAADGLPSTKWLAAKSTGWLRYEISAPTSISQYVMVSGNDFQERDPRNFSVEGSNDGLEWTMLDSQTDVVFESRQMAKTFTLNQPSAQFKYFRLNITKLKGTQNMFQLADFDPISDPNAPIDASDMKLEIGGGPASSETAKANIGWTGLKSMRYAGKHIADGPASTSGYLYKDIDVTIEPESQLSYVVFPELDGQQTYAATFVAVDLVFTDGTKLSDSGLKDSYGYLATAQVQGFENKFWPNQWNKVTIDLSALACKVVKDVLFCYSHPGTAVKNVEPAKAGTSFSGWLDDVVIDKHVPIDASDGLVSYAETRISSNSAFGFSRGNSFPAAAWPNGFNFLTPFTNANTNGSLYEYQRANNAQNLPTLQGIGFSHQPSIHMGDRNQLILMPAANASPTSTLADRALPFRHENEVARPDIYQVKFENGIVAAVTPTDHGAVFKYRFTGDRGSVIVDSGVGDAGLSISGDTVSGWVDGGSSWPGRTRMFAYGRFDATPIASGNTPSGNRSNSRYAAFDTSSDKTIEVRLATSLISVAQAKKNFSMELEDRSFEDVHESVKDAWNDRLSAITDLEGATEVQKVNLYSSLYRLNLYPNAHHENVGTVEAPVYAYASPFSPTIGAATSTETNAQIKDGKTFVNHGLWDTYRTSWPLYAFLYPKKASELVDGFVQHYRDGGWVSRWSSPGYADLMTGTSSDVSFAEAYMAGVIDTDLALEAYDSALKNATVRPPAANVGRKGLERSIFLGFTDTNTDQSASWGLEGYINDFGIANMAKKLSEDPNTPPERVAQLKDEAEYFKARSDHFVEMFSPNEGMFTGRNADGTWPASFDKFQWDGDFTEAAAWNFAFHAPQNVTGLAALYGSRQGLLDEFTAFFGTRETASNTWRPEGPGARDVRLGMLAMSNQINHHVPYVYLEAGAVSQAQEMIKDLQTRMFVGDDIGQGFVGDEDNGEFSAWYIFTALGFYPMQVGSGNYTIGRPLFDSAKVHIGDKTLTINAPGASSGKTYVAGVNVNGTEITTTTFDGSAIRDGGTMTFTMSDSPSTWGSKDLDEPLQAPVPLVDLSRSDSGSLTSADGTSVAALIDDSMSTSKTFESNSATLFLDSLAGPVKVSQYTLTSFGSTGQPSSWVLYGSTDGTEWTELDSRSDQVFKWVTQTRPFSVTQAARYSKFKLEVTSEDPQLTLAEIELLVSSDGSDELLVSPIPAPRVAVDKQFTAPLAAIVGPESEASGYSVAVDYGDGVPASDVVLTRGQLGEFRVSAPHTFEKPGFYTSTITVTDSQGTTQVARTTVEVFRDNSFEATLNNVCIGDLGLTAASCDGGGFGYFRDKLAEKGFKQGQTLAIPGTDLTYDLPAIAPGSPDNITGDGQSFRVNLGAGATRISFVGTATKSNRQPEATLQFADGTTQKVQISFGDWVGASGSPVFGNTVLAVTAGRLSGLAAESVVKNAAIYATAPVELSRDGDGKPKTVVSVVMPTEAGNLYSDGRVHVFAVASDGDRSIGGPLSLAPGTVSEQKVDEPFETVLASTIGRGDVQSIIINWGDGSPVSEGTNADGVISGGHVYTSAGTYTVTVTVDDGVKSASTGVAITVSESAPPAEPVVVRHGGLTRYDTSFEVAREVLVAGKPLFVATGLNFPDALAGGAAAAHTDGALILVGSRVPDATLALLGEKKPSEVYVLGGSGAVSELVVSQLKTATGVTPVRLSGKNRFETASKVASSFFAGATCAYVASGDDYPDALAASGKAGRDGCPIILFGRGTADLPATASSVFIVGGKGVIPEAYKDKLDHAGMSVTRLAGLDRFGTSQALQEVGASEVWVANGFSFPDALSAAAPSGKAGATMVLARKGCIPLGAKPVIGDPAVSRVHLVGGSGVLNQDVFNLKYCNN